MIKTHEAKILYHDHYAKLALLCETRKNKSANSDTYTIQRILTLDGRKLFVLKGFVLHARNNEEGIKICNHRILCYQDFFVIEKVNRHLFSKENKDFTKYETQLLDYQGKQICTYDSPWNEANYFSKEADNQ